ncbi:Pre-mRNA-splicing factor SPF27 [Elsinoe ampelina]|uniref:Pre-mRNA-splicing factor SPF27 n=1 Tax=Elsinoe ampelina TaxID=302913 RepID=A0A6A6GEL3_9PEZI|nr:Pre-mRNA-splicing factor SPF27 [Elsinoe ampelina]
MPLIQSSQDHLPHIDGPPSPTSLNTAKSLIASELSDLTLPHPSLRPLPPPTFTPAITSSLTLLSTSQPLPKLDFSRYEAPSAPDEGASKEEWTNALRSAYISTGYLSSRTENLSLLETFGRNAWLVGNSQLEDVLRDLEVEVKQAKGEVERVQSEREGMQGSVRGELEELERTWRGQVGRLLEVQVAAERVRGEVERRRREGRGG